MVRVTDLPSRWQQSLPGYHSGEPSVVVELALSNRSHGSGLQLHLSLLLELQRLLSQRIGRFKD
jgi:hypothetical protein